VLGQYTLQLEKIMIIIINRSSKNNDDDGRGRSVGK